MKMCLIRPWYSRLLIIIVSFLLLYILYSVNISMSATIWLTASFTSSNAAVETQTETYPVIWVEKRGNLTERITHYLSRLEQVRMEIWKDRGDTPWKDLVLNRKLRIIDPVEPFYMKNITHLKEVTTLFLKRLPQMTDEAYWSSRGDYENILIQNYYKWAVDKQVCDWVQVKGLAPEGWSYTPQCQSEMSATLVPTSLDPQTLNLFESYNAIYHEWYKPVVDKPPSYVTYIHIVQDAVVSELGEVYTGNIKFSPYPCTFKGPVIIYKDEYDDTVIYKEVFTIAQVFGRQVYHRNIDQLPRIAAYLDFLKKYPEIKVHIGVDQGGMTYELLRLLDIPTSRVIRWVARAHVLYVPEGSPCGMVNVPNTQLLSAKYSQVIASSFRSENPHSVIFINRTGTRHLKNNEVIFKMVESLADKYKLDLEVFGDNPAPSITEAMRMFNRAVIVVAPHGAGLFNLIFSRPGTYVIEILSSIPWLIMCFQRLAHALGMRYYGILGLGTDTLEVDLTHVRKTLEYFMPRAATLAQMYNNYT